MIKKVVILFFALVLLFVMIISVKISGIEKNTILCSDVVIDIMDNTENSFIREKDIASLLEKKNIVLKNKNISKIDFGKIENEIYKNSLVKSVECYPSSSGIVYIDVWQKNPVLRIMTGNSGYYLDEEGKVTPLSRNSSADVVIASGYINDSTMQKKLYDMALYVNDNDFWNAMLEQVYVTKKGEWILIPRVGGYEIEFGRPVDMYKKLDNLESFYKKGLPKVGWKKYSSLSVKYNNQIVCTLKR